MGALRTTISCRTQEAFVSWIASMDGTVPPVIREWDKALAARMWAAEFNIRRGEEIVARQRELAAKFAWQAATDLLGTFERTQREFEVSLANFQRLADIVEADRAIPRQKMTPQSTFRAAT